MIVLLAVQSCAHTYIHNAIMLIDTSDNASYNQVHWIIRAPYLSIKASNAKWTKVITTAKWYRTKRVTRYTLCFEAESSWFLLLLGASEISGVHCTSFVEVGILYMLLFMYYLFELSRTHCTEFICVRVNIFSIDSRYVPVKKSALYMFSYLYWICSS